FVLPPRTAIVDEQGRDAGLRFVDINEDGALDVIFSDERRYSLHLFRAKADPRLNWERGWTDEIIAQNRSAQANAIPMIVRSGNAVDNGAWFHSHSMWVQNEDTAKLKDI